MKQILMIIALTLAALVATAAFSDVVSDINKIEETAVGTAPKVIAGAILLGVAAAVAFTIFGGRAASLGTRLAVSVLTVVIAYIIVVNTEVGTAMDQMLNIKTPKAMFKRQ